MPAPQPPPDPFWRMDLWGLTLSVGRRPPAPLTESAASEPAAAAPGPLIEALERLPEPVMVVSARDPDDLADRQVVFANQAARDILRLQRSSGPLVSAVRDPEVLEAIDEALFGRMDGRAAFASVGAQDRHWLALTRPLSGGSEGGAADGACLALLLLRDETDARRSERARADFLANASHELRTPLASLSGFIETLRGHARDDVAARERFLGIMQAQAERMSRLIDDLMSLSRIELNEHIAPAGRVDLALAVTDVVDALAPLAQTRGVRLAADLPPHGAVLAEGDRDQIVQVAQNLIDNALKYTPDGGTVRIQVLSGPETAVTAPRTPGASRLTLLSPDHAAGEVYAALRVADEGPGIAREHLPRLTERFYRVEGQKSGERSGTGLGLAIVKHIINRHRGGLMVESALGEGAAFTAWLPVARAARERTAEAVTQLS
jgi:two-component system phosphate regulon sensor histidine kinase PhoR